MPPTSMVCIALFEMLTRLVTMVISTRADKLSNPGEPILNFYVLPILHHDCRVYPINGLIWETPLTDVL